MKKAKPQVNNSNVISSIRNHLGFGSWFVYDRRDYRLIAVFKTKGIFYEGY